jgi:hypothetical protein
MAKSPAGPGVYSPWNYRARRLIRQLRAATHRTVQNAIIAELIHELEKGSRRVRKQAGWLRRQAPQWGRKVAAATRKRAGSAAHRVWHGPRMECCGQQFHNRLEFGAHAMRHRREGRQPAPGRPARATGRDRGYLPGRGRLDDGGPALDLKHPAEAHAERVAHERKQAAAHARDVIGAAGKHGRAAQAAARSARATGPLTAKDLREMARQTRAAAPQSPTRAHANLRPMDPAALKAAREQVQTPESRARSRQLAILRRSLRVEGRTPARAPRTAPRAAPALKLAPAPARAPRPARTAPARPGRTT